MDLRNFYLENISKDEYYYQFYELVEKVNFVDNVFSGPFEKYDFKFEIYDTEEGIEKFRELCQPGNEDSMSNEQTCWFYTILFYLNKQGYYIKEFPRLVERPPHLPFTFIYKDIRNKLIDEGKDDDGIVRYDARRKLIRNLTFVKKDKYIDLEYDVEAKFKEISNRKATFQEMTTDEKLAEIINLIEHMLKVNGKYVKLDYTKNCFDYINDRIIVKYKDKLQCFRHSSSQSLSERENFSELQKKFMVDYGIVILNGIHISMKDVD
uniref:hypothetical protein n=1 Tax=Lactococcus garvieae TaxID=1363 RepID=UPI00359C40FD